MTKIKTTPQHLFHYLTNENGKLQNKVVELTGLLQQKEEIHLHHKKVVHFLQYKILQLSTHNKNKEETQEEENQEKDKCFGYYNPLLYPFPYTYPYTYPYPLLPPPLPTTSPY